MEKYLEQDPGVRKAHNKCRAIQPPRNKKTVDKLLPNCARSEKNNKPSKTAQQKQKVTQVADYQECSRVFQDTDVTKRHS